jgi:outer membrane protein OmpA-like peptidoglycan-associated protein
MQRRWGVAALLVVAIVTGCQTAPKTPAPEASPLVQPKAALKSFGFVESDDGWTLSLADPILFDVSRDDVKPESAKSLAGVAHGLLQVGIREVRVEGHTDNVGNRAYNIELSRRRAEAVARVLIANGFPDAGIKRRGLAAEYPVAANETADGRAQNRRVTIVVVPPDNVKD